MVRLSFRSYLLCSAYLPLRQASAAPTDSGLSGGVINDNTLVPKAVVNSIANNDLQLQANKPIYAIAHRVLSDYGVRAALSHGANAIEIDMTAWWNTGPAAKGGPGWWADHDGKTSPSPSWGASARDIFRLIANQKKSAKRIVTFVWLDIKTPDYCNPGKRAEYKCSIASLRDVAREILEPAGIRVLYGFYGKKPGIGYKTIAGSLNGNEAMNYDGTRKDVLAVFNSLGPRQVSKRIYSYGDTQIGKGFGNCFEKDHNTCTELRQAAASKAFGKAFGWTSLPGTFQYGSKELSHGVDGLIYGCQKNGEYREENCARQAYRDIQTWVAAHKGTHHMATQQDKPW